ncbi:hypothetical protein B0A48_07478 [Cryoendolithus antarcticus]|uniref:Fe2OG dioxygenase domain-containing protein n=1 Tax=Cryoendolithus antarcticus TaxID=1507870 RepID=A0A1V8T6V3_9PEZI|nr:hypothetical protein B0A48_07478 [Cryoendolithus antarcticus]
MAAVMSQTSTSQLGASAIAPPALPHQTLPPAPALHHLEQDDPKEDHNEDLAYPNLPPFPSDIPTAPLLRISLSKLLSNDLTEITNLWNASRDLGFFYLDLRSPAPSTTKRDSAHEPSECDIDGSALLSSAEKLFSLGEKLFQLPTEEKLKYDFKDQGSYFGYKGIGAGVVDAQGTKDRNEFYNVSKDDILGISEPLPAPELLSSEDARDLLRVFMEGSHAIVTFILRLLNDKLGLPEGKLQALHRLHEVSGDQVRWVSAPPQPQNDQQKALGEHTDFGSITLLHNRLGGLQVLPPSSPSTPKPEWTYVLPLRHHIIVNLGDALVKLTAGVLRSNIHRVVSPPGEQGKETRMSLVYFARPEDEVVLKRLEGSKVIDQKATESGEEDGEWITAKEWILRRALGRRAGGDWKASAGTEGERFKH